MSYLGGRLGRVDPISPGSIVGAGDDRASLDVWGVPHASAVGLGRRVELSSRSTDWGGGCSGSTRGV